MTVNLPPRWSLDQLREQATAEVVLWATPSVRLRLQEALPWPMAEPDRPLPPGVGWLVVAGGGELMDRAKALRAGRPGLKLVAIPSIWGSGAEASPIIVRSDGGRKEILINPSAVPDAVVYWPELARSVPAGRQREACGDCWSHALEGFLSPLATPQLREALADVIRRLLALPLAYDPRWFDLSALACAGQAQAGVGLVHGIAHTLEGPLQQQQPSGGWHHARLCAIFLHPVMQLNRDGSERCHQLLAEHQLSESALCPVLQRLCEPDGYREALPGLRAEWRQILRDPCTRTNSVLVRPDWLERFERLVLI